MQKRQVFNPFLPLNDPHDAACAGHARARFHHAGLHEPAEYLRSADLTVYYRAARHVYFNAKL